MLGRPSGLIKGLQAFMCTKGDADVTGKASGPWSLGIPPNPCVCLLSGHRVLSQTPQSPPNLHICLCPSRRKTQKEAFLTVLNLVTANRSFSRNRVHSQEPDKVHGTNSTIFLFYSPPLSALKCKFVHPRFQSRLPWRHNSTVFLMTLVQANTFN